MSEARSGYSDHIRHFVLDRDTVFLNHGSFGACPQAVLVEQERWRRKLESQPVRFFTREYEPALDVARAELAAFLCADRDGLVFVTNATTGVNTALAALPLAEGDEILTTDHEYNACKNALDRVAERARARVVVARVPFPLATEAEATGAILGAVTARTRFALLDHVTSPTGLVMPIEMLVEVLKERGIETIVDGAHAPGMLPLAIDAMGPAFYTGNAHKWICAPKGAAFLWVRADWREHTRPLVTSHGANSPRTDRARFQIEFDWTGTHDPSAVLAIPEALRVMGGMLDGGWDALRAANRSLAFAGRQVLCDALRIAPPSPASMIGSLAAIPIPDHLASPEMTGPVGPLDALFDSLQRVLAARYRIEVPIVPWPAPPHRLVRISAQIYNTKPQYETLARALGQELKP